MAARICNRMNAAHVISEAAAAADFALYQAAEVFEESRGVAFIPFARQRIKGAVWDELRRLQIVDRRHASAKAKPWLRILESECGPYPVDLFDPGPPAARAQFEMRHSLDTLMNAVLLTRERFVLQALFWRDWDGRQIGAALGVNQARVYQLRRSGLAKLAAEYHIKRRRRPPKERKPYLVS